MINAVIFKILLNLMTILLNILIIGKATKCVISEWVYNAFERLHSKPDYRLFGHNVFHFQSKCRTNCDFL